MHSIQEFVRYQLWHCPYASFSMVYKQVITPRATN